MHSAYGFSKVDTQKGRPLLERLMARTMPVPFSGCWIWTGGLYNRDYGMAFLPGGKPILAHRAMMIAMGHSLGPKDTVCHHCDVPMCVNPDHLFIGTQADNLADMMRKGRHRPSHVIAPEWREKIRNDDTPAWAVAMWFGVSQGTIGNIRRGK